MNSHVARRVFVLIVVLGGQSNPVAQVAPSISPAMAQRIDALFAPWDNTRSPGCALGISQRGTAVYSRGYGMANLEYDVPIRPDSVFDIGSVSKQFTAFAIALLAQNAALSLDDDIRRYLPELADYGQRMTIRHLLGHTSGVRDAGVTLHGLAGWRVGQGRFEVSPLQEPITEEDVMRMTVRQQSLDFMPGAEYSYSNTGYTLLAVIVKRVSGQSLRNFADARIFKPLGMLDTQFVDDPTTIVPRRASAYKFLSEGQTRIHVPRSTVVGPTGLYTTVGDMLKWEENLVDAKVGGRALLDEMQTSGRLNDGRPTNYGFGINLLTYRGMRRIGHGGNDFAYVAEAYRFPEHHLAMVVLCNVETVPILIPRLAEIVLGSDAFAPVAPRPTAMPVPKSELSALAGTYWSPLQIMRLVINGSELNTSNGELLTPLGDGRFRVGNSSNEVVFAAAKGEPPQQLRLVAPRGDSVLIRATAPAYSDTQLKEFGGAFRSDELDVVYTIGAAPEGGLVVRRPKVDPLPLAALARDTFLLRESLADAIVFTRAPSGEVNGFFITGASPRHLSFTKVRGPSSIVK